MAAALTWGIAVTAVAAQHVQVTPLAREGRVLVSFSLPDAFTDELRASILSGLPTTFTYDVELRRSRPAWIDRTIAAARVVATVRYDNLTRRYQVSLMQDGRVEDVRMLEEEVDVRRWTTEFDRLPLFSTGPLEANAEYYVRVRAQTRPRNSWFFWPWDGAASAFGSTKFTFLP